MSHRRLRNSSDPRRQQRAARLDRLRVNCDCCRMTFALRCPAYAPTTQALYVEHRWRCPKPGDPAKGRRVKVALADEVRAKGILSRGGVHGRFAPRLSVAKR